MYSFKKKKKKNVTIEMTPVLTISALSQSRKYLLWLISTRMGGVWAPTGHLDHPRLYTLEIF